jgi:hypothetical protein
LIGNHTTGIASEIETLPLREDRMSQELVDADDALWRAVEKVAHAERREEIEQLVSEQPMLQHVATLLLWIAACPEVAKLLVAEFGAGGAVLVLEVDDDAGVSAAELGAGRPLDAEARSNGRPHDGSARSQRPVTVDVLTRRRNSHRKSRRDLRHVSGFDAWT